MSNKVKKNGIEMTKIETGEIVVKHNTPWLPSKIVLESHDLDILKEEKPPKNFEEVFWEVSPFIILVSIIQDVVWWIKDKLHDPEDDFV